jgi:hypothetical protein
MRIGSLPSLNYIMATVAQETKTVEVHELEQQMDALAREYAATRDQKIIAKLYDLSRRLRELEEQ